MQFFYLIRRTSNFRLLLIIFVVALSFACSKSGAESAKQQNANNQGNTESLITVTTDKAISRDVPAVIQTTGSLVADETSDIAPKVAGKVVNIYANVGEFVKSGSVLAKIDDKDARLQLLEAQTNVKQAIAGVRQAEARLGLSPNGNFNASNIPEVRAANANYEQTQAELRQAEVNLRQAEVNEKRYRELVETGDVAMIVYEQYRATRDVAVTARETARSRVNSAKQQLEATINNAKQNNQLIKSAEASVESSRTQVTIAEQAIADTVVRAPFSGFISARPTAVGEYVTSSTPVATILRSNPIKLQMQVAEADVSYISIGRAVSLEVDAYKDRTFGGTVTAVNPAIDPISRSVVVEAQVENSNNALRSGMFVTAKIVREGGSTGIFVPKAAVYDDQATQSRRVYVIVEGIAKQRTIQLGTEENGFYQILSGINADETVAVSNLDQLYEGAKVVF